MLGTQKKTFPIFTGDFYLTAFVHLAKDTDDLFYGMAFFLHDSGWLLARQNLIGNGPVFGGQVTPLRCFFFGG